MENNEELDGTLDFDLDDTNMDAPMVEVKKTKKASKTSVKSVESTDKPLINCLRNERITVRFIPKAQGIWGSNPKHVMAGGMLENGSRTFVVPRLSSGIFVNILTDDEKKYLENILGFEDNAMSIYKKVDNFWDDSNENGINKVRLTKQDTYLNLSDPEDYIRYKILLANKNNIAPSIQAMQDTPKATYQYVLIAENEETKHANLNMSATMQCYKEFGKIENDFDVLRMIVETLEGRPVAKSTKLDFLKTKVNSLIQSNSKLFLKVITDTLLPTKVLIKKGIEAGIISNRGGFLYFKADNTPLCEDGEEPTLNIAARYLNTPKHQEEKFILEAKLK